MRTTKRMMLCVTVLLIMCCLSCRDDKNDDETLLPDSVKAMTLDDVQAAKMTSLIGQEILLYENIGWNNAIGIPEVLPYLWYKETDSCIEIYSSDLTRKLREFGRIEFYYQGRELKRKKRYYLQGAFHYSRRFIQPQPIDELEFIELVNNPIYWNDIIEFRLTGLSETPPQ